jgi:phosphoribosylamine--glycine ligase
MKILLIGNGAREHAIAEALKRSSKNPEIITFAKAKNPGIFGLSSKYEIGDLMDFEHLKNFVKDKNIDFAIVGPDDPIGAGAVDALEEVGIKSMAPRESLARLESSKSFTRDLLAKYGIDGNPKFKVFELNSLSRLQSNPPSPPCQGGNLKSPQPPSRRRQSLWRRTVAKGGNIEEDMRDFMNELDGQFVVKADGLTGGKGVKVVGDHLDGIDDGLKYAEECIESDGRVVIEEKFVGQEFSLMSFVDGKTAVDMPAVQDHKRAFDGDKGPNTGGMGTYSYPDILPFLTQKDLDDAHNITVEVMKALEQECGEPFKGIMYGGFIITKNGVKLIEYNARFGDPEAMNVLPLLETDFVDVCLAVINQTLSGLDIKFSKKATVCKYVAPQGYPGNPAKGEKIEVGEMPDGAKIYYASVDEKDGELYLGGSRAIAVVGIADDISDAERIAEDGVCRIKGPIFHRRDIGTSELIGKRVEMMRGIRKNF